MSGVLSLDSPYAESQPEVLSQGPPYASWLWQWPETDLSRRPKPITTTPEAEMSTSAWVEEAAQRLQDISFLPANWDGEGSPAPKADIVHAAIQLLLFLADRLNVDIPAPFVSPIPGGGVQLDWDIGERHLEMELLQPDVVGWLMERTEAGEPRTDTGEYPVRDVPNIVLLLERIATD